MPESFRTLSATLQSRALYKSRAPRNWVQTMRDLQLEGLRTRNAALDAMFYDVKVVTPEECAALAPWLAAEGAIVHVPPTGAGGLTVCASVDEFAERFGATRALAVAGLGGSALGAAAFARNVADAIGAPVAAVVSGYGFADFVAEGAGGFFLFGAANVFRHAFEWVDRATESGHVADPATSRHAFVNTSPMQRSKVTRTVEALLMHPGLEFELLVGHSKGNLVISEALFGIGREDPSLLERLGRELLIVTISAKIAMPPPCARVVDVMGALDNFGTMNSRADIPTDVLVANAWHGTNTARQWSLPVTETLRGIAAVAEAAATPAPRPEESVAA